MVGAGGAVGVREPALASLGKTRTTVIRIPNTVITFFEFFIFNPSLKHLIVLTIILLGRSKRRPLHKTAGRQAGGRSCGGSWYCSLIHPFPYLQIKNRLQVKAST
jgi:hypothetical protein